MTQHAPSPAADAPADATPAVTPVPIIDVVVGSNSLRSKRLVVDDVSLTWDSTTVRFDEIVHFAYEMSRNRTALAPAHTGYMFTLWTGDTSVFVEFVTSAFSKGTTKHDTQLLFESLVALLHERVGDRLISTALTHLRAGGTVEYGAVALRRNGVEGRFHLRRRHLAWDDIAGAEFAGGDVVIHRWDGEATKPVFKVSMAIADAVLLPDLLHMAAAQHRSARLRRGHIHRNRAAHAAHAARRTAPVPALG